MTQRNLLALVLAIGLTGCTSFGGHNVVFGSKIQQVDHSETVHRVYFDRLGDIYPGKSYFINDAGMARASTLREYFSSENDTCRNASASDACVIGALTGAAEQDAAWRRVQDQWFDEAAGNVAKSARGRELVVLVHGFRVEDASGVYRRARNLIEERYATAGSAVAFLEVHWDGLASPTPIGVWGEAQVNGFLAGLSLRRILAKLHADTKVRIMTHSSGGFVIAATLGDPGAVFGRVGRESQLFAEFRANAKGSGRFPIPSGRDLRVAMVVPATPAASFKGGKDADGRAHDGMISDAMLIVGVNEKDVGVSKGPINGALSIFGSSDLGQSLKAFCSLRAALSVRSSDQRPPAPRLINFQGSAPVTRAAVFWEAHDWELYLERAKMQKMIDLLIGQSLDAKGDESDCL